MKTSLAVDARIGACAVLLLCAACWSPSDGPPAAGTDTGESSGVMSTSSESSAGDSSGSIVDNSEGESSSDDDSSETSVGESTDEGDSTGAEPANCEQSLPFTELRLIEELSTDDDEGNHSLSPDELTVYFFSNRQSPGTADLDLYVATRESFDAPFGVAAPVDAINSGSDDRGGWIMPDELSLYFYSSRAGGYDLYVSSRGNVAAPWGAPEPLGGDINTEAFEQNPYVTSDGASLYFTRDEFLYRAALGPAGFSQPMPVGELNDEGVGPMLLTADGTTIYFASSRPGGAGGWDIWRATRDDPDGVFEESMNVSELNSGDFEFPEWISSDGCRLYVTSRRPEGQGGWDMWVAERMP